MAKKNRASPGFSQGFDSGSTFGLTFLLSLSVFCASMAVALYVQNEMLSIVAVAGAWGSAITIALSIIVWLFFRGRDLLFRQALLRLMRIERAPCFLTDASGTLKLMNYHAQERFGPDEESLILVLRDYFVNPASVMHRLSARAGSMGYAAENIYTRQEYLRFSVTRISPERFLWRFEGFTRTLDSAPLEPMAAPADMSVPLLRVDDKGNILFANTVAVKWLGEAPKTLSHAFGPEPLSQGDIAVPLRSLSGDVIEKKLVAILKTTQTQRELIFLPISILTQNAQPSDGLKALPVALIRFSDKGDMIEANQIACEMLKIEPTEKHMFSDLYEGLGRPVQDWLTDVVRGRVKNTSEFLHPRSGGAETSHQVILRRIMTEKGYEVLAVLQDATAFKLMEAQFAQSQKMQAIGQLAGGIAHDFNNLLTAISGHCDLLLLRHTQDDIDYADLIQVQQNANRAAALVNQLLAFSRKQTLKPECLDLQDVISDLTHLLNRLVGERVQLRFVHGVGIGTVRVDKRHFEQVLMNLVVNARDAMPAGGTITLETKAVTLTQEMHRDRAVVPPGEYTLIEVVDTGCGIPPERIGKIFEPFYTTKRQGDGTGLGLSMVYGIVKQSGGFIFVDSSLEEGTSFHLYFPVDTLRQEEEKIDDEKAKNIIMRQGEGVILLAEDEASVRAFASRALKMRGYTVLEADSGEAALAIASNLELKIDLFVSDVVMPGIDGPGWVKQALEARPHTKSIFMSGYAEDNLFEEQARIPDSVFLPKPFSLSELTKIVQQQLAVS